MLDLTTFLRKDIYFYANGTAYTFQKVLAPLRILSYAAEVSPYMKYIRFFIVMILCVSNRKERRFISLICPSGVN